MKTRNKVLIIVGSVVGGLLTLCCLGGAVIMITAPDPGEATRQQVLPEQPTWTTSCGVRIEAGGERAPGWEFVAEATISNPSDVSVRVEATAYWAQYARPRFEMSEAVTVQPNSELTIPFAAMDYDHDLKYTLWTDADRDCGVEVEVTK